MALIQLESYQLKPLSLTALSSLSLSLSVFLSHTLQLSSVGSSPLLLIDCLARKRVCLALSRCLLFLNPYTSTIHNRKLDSRQQGMGQLIDWGQSTGGASKSPILSLELAALQTALFAALSARI